MKLRAGLSLWQSRLPLLVAAALLLAGIGMTFASEQSYRDERILTVTIQADVLAKSVGAALSFDDAEAAQAAVQAFAVNPRLEAIAVYDAKGETVASFARSGAAPLPAAPTERASYVLGNDVHVASPVTEAGAVLGHVYVRASKEPWSITLPRYAGAAFLVIMASLLAFVVLAAQSDLRRKNTELAAANDALRAEMVQRAASEEALRRSQKMEAIGQLTGGVAHDFNNMLAVIVSAISLTKKRLATGNADIGTLLDAALDGSNRAARLVSRLLAFSRQQPLRPEPMNASKFVAGMTELLQRTLGEHIQVETVLGAGLWRVHADSSQLENAVLNLSVNARDAMPGGGRLTVETSNTMLDEAYARENSEAKAGQYVLIAVSDTGSGMPPEVIERAFDPFFTTKPVGAGTGLGLSQVFGFVRQSGGFVKIYSEVGHGTTVKIYLPRYYGADEEMRPVPAAAERLRKEDVCEIILVVEDEQRLREMTVTGLRELGYTVLEASGGAEALRVLDAHPEVHCLFTDIVMPEINGRQLADEARRRRPDLKVLFTTGYTRNAVVHNGVLDPGVHLLPKPYALDDLARKVREVLGGAPPI